MYLAESSRAAPTSAQRIIVSVIARLPVRHSKLSPRCHTWDFDASAGLSPLDRNPSGELGNFLSAEPAREASQRWVRPHDISPDDSGFDCNSVEGVAGDRIAVDHDEIG